MKTNNYAIVVHGGAGPDSALIQTHKEEYKRGLQEAVNAGYTILESGGAAIDAVQAAVVYLENHPLFNAGKGAELNENGEAELCASIMNGSTLRCGAVAITKHVKNPVILARTIMEESEHIYLGDAGAEKFAREHGIELRDGEYFKTKHTIETYRESKEKQQKQEAKKATHGTVGAVACDKDGNVAAATSTGGTEMKAQGRIGDSSMIGIGSYADNNTCAVSTTGEGEDVMKHMVAHALTCVVQYEKKNVAEAAKYLIDEKLKTTKGDIGLIAIDRDANIGIAFNSARMHRAWRTSDGAVDVKIYGD